MMSLTEKLTLSMIERLQKGGHIGQPLQSE
jgi:hypothetical protein